MYHEGVKRKNVNLLATQIYLMEKFSWDYYTLIRQPAWLIENIIRYLDLEEECKEKNVK